MGRRWPLGHDDEPCWSWLGRAIRKKDGVQLGGLGSGPISQGNKEFLYIFNSFHYLPTKYDSNSNFKRLLSTK
jgi:hypothetical protein